MAIWYNEKLSRGVRRVSLLKQILPTVTKSYQRLTDTTKDYQEMAKGCQDSSVTYISAKLCVYYKCETTIIFC